MPRVYGERQQGGSATLRSSTEHCENCLVDHVDAKLALFIATCWLILLRTLALMKLDTVEM